jgi:transitional endoplasmic reticulum ATPase
VTTTLSVGEPAEGVTVDPGAVRLPATAAGSLGVTPGDAVTVRGARNTVASVGQHHRGDVVVLGDDVARNADATPGDTVTVATATVQPAVRVVLAPTQPVALGGAGAVETVRTAVGDRPLSVDDSVAVSLFRGAMEVTLRVVEVVPEGAVRLTDETEVSVRRRSAGATTGPELPRVAFDALAGVDDTVTELRRLVERPLTDPGRYYDRDHAVDGVLLAGPTGAGKTTVAGALATAVEDDAEVVVVDPAVSTRNDDLEKRLAVDRDTPTLVVIEDVDVLAPAGDGGTTAARLGAALDRLRDRRAVVLGTATDADEVDARLRRGGRFDREVTVGALDAGDRAAILQSVLGDHPLDGVDLATLGERTGGYVGADLLALVRAAVDAALSRAETDAGVVPLVPADFETALTRTAPSGLREVTFERPGTDFGDVGGLADAKRELTRTVEWPLRRPDVFERAGVDPPRGVLLYGPPGTGMTLLVRAIAGRSDAAFIAVDGPELLNRYVGESERGVRELFARARRNAPAVVFFDEVDALAGRRGDADTDAVDRVVSQLLTELDGIRERENVVVVGATNRPDTVDPALLRPGRFERLVEVPMPDQAARRAILDVHTREVRVENVDLDEVAADTEGYTGGDLEAVVREAVSLAIEAAVDSTDGDLDAVDVEGLVVGPEEFDRAVGAVRPSVTAAMREEYETIGARLRDD